MNNKELAAFIKFQNESLDDEREEVLDAINQTIPVWVKECSSKKEEARRSLAAADALAMHSGMAVEHAVKSLALDWGLKTEKRDRKSSVRMLVHVQQLVSERMMKVIERKLKL